MKKPNSRAAKLRQEGFKVHPKAPKKPKLTHKKGAVAPWADPTKFIKRGGGRH